NAIVATADVDAAHAHPPRFVLRQNRFSTSGGEGSINRAVGIEAADVPFGDIVSECKNLPVVLDGDFAEVCAIRGGEAHFAPAPERSVGSAVGIESAQLQALAVDEHQCDEFSVALDFEIRDLRRAGASTVEIDDPAGPKGCIEASFGIGAPELGAGVG